jgi:transcriptional regulator with XRE-family HTH domain
MHKFYGRKLQALRKKKKLSINELAELVGKTARTVGAWERGERNPSLSDIRVMCDILGVGIEEISDSASYFLKKKKDALNTILSTEDKIQNLFESKLNIDQKAFLYSLLGVFRGLKKSQDELTMENDHLKKTLDSIPIVVFAKDNFRRFTFTNLHFKHVAICSNAIGKTNEKVFSKSLNAELTIIEDKVYNKHESVYSYVATLDDNGFNRYLSISLIPIIENHVVVMTVGCIIDVSQRMNSLRNYKLLEHVIDSISTVVWVRYRKPVKHVVFLNSAIEKIVGISQKELNRNSNLWMEIIHPDDQVRFKRWSDAWFNMDDDVNLKKSKIYRIIDKNGEVRKVLDERAFFDDENGEIVDFGLIKDISRS